MILGRSTFGAFAVDRRELRSFLGGRSTDASRVSIDAVLEIEHEMLPNFFVAREAVGFHPDQTQDILHSLTFSNFVLTEW